MTIESTEEITGKLLLKKNLTVSTAESCTGGLLSSRLTDISGSSAYIRLNFITYSNEAKIKILGVPAEILSNHGAVSEQTADAMATGARKISETNIGIGITGIACTDGGTSEKPVGLVYIGISNGEIAEVHKININPQLERKEIKFSATEFALNYLKLFIEKNY